MRYILGMRQACLGRTTIVAVCIGALLLLAGGEAFAKDATELFDQGLRQMQGGDPAGARVSFLEAYGLAKQPKFEFQLAIAELRSNRPLDGLRHLKEYVKDPRISDKDRANAQPYLEEAMLRTGHVRVEAPASLEISVANTRIGVTPLATDVDVEADKDTDIEASVAAPTGSAPAPGSRKIQSVHCPAGKTVTIRFDALPGMTVATTVLPNGGVTTTVVPPGGGGEQPQRSEYSSGRTIVPVVLLGVGVLGLVGAGVFTGLSNSSKSDAETAALSGPCAAPSSQACGDLKGIQDTQNSRATLSYAALGVGALGLAAAAVT
jgi:hypothetical protein